MTTASICYRAIEAFDLSIGAPNQTLYESNFT